jgi:hypothetical protein
MVHIYYHIYAVDGVETIIDEQLNLIKSHFDFPYILNVGISIGQDNKCISDILSTFDNVRDVRVRGNEFVTLDLIEKDKDKFGDSDYILYLHTKGASKQDNKNVITWRHLMNYFNIEKVKNVFKLFEKTDFNTYGVLLKSSDNFKPHYSGNFWWMKWSYGNTIKIESEKQNRFNAELDYIQNGIDWKPYSPYNIENQNPYLIEFKREEYAK